VALFSADLGALQVAGVGVATAAVYVANYRSGSLLDPLRAAARSRAAGLALLSAVVYAVSDVGKRVALGEMDLAPELWVPTLLGGVLVVLLPLAARAWPGGGAVRPYLPRLAGAGLLVALGEHVTSLAFAVVPASVASPVINTQAVVAVVLGGLLLGEEALGTRLAAAALAVSGVALIAA
jgi:drug/metabolite transporter (DMT)-like permease